MPPTTSGMLTGLDRLATAASTPTWLRGRKVGALAHPASVTRRYEHLGSVLTRLGVRPSILFGPEHGFGGEAQDMVGVADAVDAQGTPIRSLYGDAFEDLSPKDTDLRGLDVLVIDLQDVGSRYYTFVWTALLALRSAARLGIETVVLDRPNPIDGVTLEGKLQDAGFESFVGLEPLPIRHGLTVGEVLALRAAEEGLPKEALRIVSSEWNRVATAHEWDRGFVLPSPNMPTPDTALVYPGGCLLEGTNLSDGRGTTKPFEITGAPFVDGEQLSKGLVETGLPGFFARPLVFFPMFHKHAKQACGGVQIHVTDARTFRPVATYVALIALARRMAPEEFCFRTERYEFVDHIPAFDLLTGSASAREAMLAGSSARDVAEAVSAVGEGATLHERARRAIGVHLSAI